jgi:Sec-independent protein translocase protein TatA
LFGGIGGLEILIILVIGIVVFGIIKMPQIARILGSGMSGYKRLKKGFSIEDIVKVFKGDDEQKQDREAASGEYYNQRPSPPPRTDQPGSAPWRQDWRNSDPGNQGFGNQGQGLQGPQGHSGQHIYPPPQQPPNRSYPPENGNGGADPQNQEHD